ncbi:hypothetical protein BCV71DRAFT_215462 [Rhizopus microsporus]|uniref:Uncharacterized protein n=1 Tax=Rhizopus microsporus TaxID=58291 RepID=A0A1X0S1Q7_RHIZD|nr:hypothetical protein BCV71DRAFT_215462 [Rhizopus microsporus]
MNTCSFSQGRNTTARAMEEIMHILRWDKPLRSSVLFLSLMSIIYLVQSYSIVQIILCTLTLTTVINFVYVYAVKFFQKISNTSFKHPFIRILDNKDQPILNKERILYYVSSSVDLADAVIRVVTKVILVENPKKSALTLVRYGPNQAHNTPPHISILPRILIQRQETADIESKWQTVQDLIDCIDQQIHSLQLTVPDFAGYQILDKPTRSLIMNVKVHNDYYTLVETVESVIGPACAVLETHLLDKIHLAYNVLKSPSKVDLKKMKQMAESTIDIYDWVKSGGSWRLTLHEVMIESQVVGVQHQLKEVRSWPVQPRPPQQFADLLPVSVRIKLPWLNYSAKKQTYSSIDHSSGISSKSATSSNNKGLHTL